MNLMKLGVQLHCYPTWTERFGTGSPTPSSPILILTTKGLRRFVSPTKIIKLNPKP